MLAQATPPDESGHLVPSVPMRDLPVAQVCAVALPWFGHDRGQYMPPHGTIALSNDGGWCWMQFAQDFRHVPFVPDIRVATPPAHGEVVVERMTDRVAVAYRPASGFVGTDHFSVRTNGPLPHTIPIDVTVK